MAKKKAPATGKKSKHRFSFKEGDAPKDKPSAFEARSQLRKFDILGRKVKGEKGNALKARSAGVTKRKNTLLKEYQALGKANAFVDRRFGEDNPTMTPEERSIGRLARTRLRQLRPGKQSYSLNDEDDGGDGDDGDGGGGEDDGLQLTHGGQPIDERDLKRRSEHQKLRGKVGRNYEDDDDDDDDPGGLDGEMTGALHFGGGDGDGGAFEPTLKRGDHGVEGGDGDGGDGRRKTKKEVMEELIAKSKYHKGQKTKQREADEDALDKLDDEFRTISSAGLFRAALAKGVGHLKPEGWDPTRKLVPGAKAAAEAAGGEVVKDDYDRLARELALEARGQATNRTRTTEEVEAAEAAALQEAERGRLKRMRGDSDDDDDDGDGDGPASGGYAARRAKARKQAAKRAGKDNEDEDDDTDEDEDRDGIPKKKGHKEGRLGGDDLEGNFEEEEEDSEDEEGSGSEDEEEEGSDEEEEESSDGDEDEDEDGDGDGDGDMGMDMLAQDDKKAMTKSLKREVKKVTDTMDEGKKRLRKLGILKDGGGEESGEDEDMDDLKDDEKEEANEEDEDEEESGEEAGEESGEESEEESGEEEEVEVEETKEKKEESKQQKTVAVPAAPGAALPFTFPMPATPQALEKIVGALSPVDAAVALDRIRKCHAPTLREDNRKKTQLFFGLLLQRFEVLAGAASIPVAHLDVLAAALAAVAVSVPFFAVTAARARLEKMAARLRRALRDGQTGWPPARTLLLLALFADLFPATDKQHPVTTPAALYLGHVMSHCAVRSAREAVTAVVAGALAAAYSAPAGRVFPEAVTLLAGLVHAAGVGDASGDGAWGEGLPLHVREQVGGPWLAPDMTTAALDAKKQSKKKKGEVEEALSLASGANGGLSLDGGRQLGASQPISIEGGGGLLSLATMLSMSSAGAGGAEANPGLPGGVPARHAALAAAVATLRTLAAPAASTASATEILGPVQAAAARLYVTLSSGGRTGAKKGASSQAVLTGALAAAVAACEGIKADASSSTGTLRAPLAWRTKSADAIKQFNPMYEEEGFQKGRDYDPNRERANKRQLQRELKQEARGAVRELRKDNRFLAEQRAEESNVAKDERGERQRETMSFLEKLEGDMRSGGQGGMVVKTQKRVNGGAGRDRKKR